VTDERRRKKLEWAYAHMKILQHINEDFTKRKPFKDINIALSIHLEAKTANLAIVLKNGGANIYVSGSNPLSTQDDIVEALKNLIFPYLPGITKQTRSILKTLIKLSM